MPIDNSKKYYGSIARSLHWLVASLVIATLVIAELRGHTTRGSDLRKLVSNAHYQIGVAIFILGWLWLGWRVRQVQPSITPADRLERGGVVLLCHADRAADPRR